MSKFNIKLLLAFVAGVAVAVSVSALSSSIEEGHMWRVYGGEDGGVYCVKSHGYLIGGLFITAETYDDKPGIVTECSNIEKVTQNNPG